MESSVAFLSSLCIRKHISSYVVFRKPDHYKIDRVLHSHLHPISFNMSPRFRSIEQFVHTDAKVFEASFLFSSIQH